MSVTPLMQMTLPTVGVTSGSAGNSQYITAFNVVDAHDHTSGKGTQVPSAGININAALSFQSFSATSLRSTNFSSQSASFSSSSDNSSVYVVGGELYFKDGSGNNVAITTGGSVAGATGSISSLSSPASAQFSTPTFIWKSDATTFAKMRASDLEIYPATSGASFKLIQKVNSSIAADYTLTWPTALPASTKYVTSDNAGAITFSSADEIATAMTSTGANAVATTRTRTTGTTVAAGGVAISSGLTGSEQNTTTTLADVTGCSVTITTTGRPVFVGLMSNGTQAGYIQMRAQLSGGSNGQAYGRFVLKRDTTTISETAINVLCLTSSNESITGVPVSSIQHIDNVAAGTYTYKLQQAGTSSSGAYTTRASSVAEAKLIAYEL